MRSSEGEQRCNQRNPPVHHTLQDSGSADRPNRRCVRFESDSHGRQSRSHGENRILGRRRPEHRRYALSCDRRALAPGSRAVGAAESVRRLDAAATAPACRRRASVPSSPRASGIRPPASARRLCRCSGRAAARRQSPRITTGFADRQGRQEGIVAPLAAHRRFAAVLLRVGAAGKRRKAGKGQASSRSTAGNRGSADIAHVSRPYGGMIAGHRPAERW